MQNPRGSKGLRRALLPVFTFARIDFKRLFRDKVAIFFVFVFPLIFLLVFGTLFRGDNGDVSFSVGLINQADNEFSRQFEKQMRENELLEIDKEVTNLSQARDRMNRSEIDATIILPENFGVLEGRFPRGQAQILYDQNNQQAGQALGAVMQDVFRRINQRLAPAETPFTVETKSTATRGLTQFDYTFAGLLGFTLLSMGIYGPTTVFPRLKQRGVLRRYHTTTIRVWQYFLGNVLSNAAVGLLSVVVMFAAAVLLFDLNMRGDYLSLAAVVILGTTMLFGIGLAIGGWAKNENQAAPIAQLVTLPMMFLSGVFFPTFLMPEWLQGITRFIPLTPIIDSVRFVVTEGKTFLDLGPQLAVMLGWTLIVYIVAFKVFRWE